MKKCPYCGNQMEDDNLFCTECGKPVPQGNVCPHCGASVNKSDSFCQNCGKKIEDDPSGSVSEPALSHVEDRKTDKSKRIILFALIAIAVIVVLFFCGRYGYKVYSDYIKEKEARELFVKDSLEKVRQDSIKLAEEKEAERLEAEKLAKFREKLTMKNILNLINDPENKSFAQNCGLSFLYKDTDREDTESYMIVYGYDIEKGDKKEALGYDVKALSGHACYFHNTVSRWGSKGLHFNNKADADYLLEMLKKNGFSENGDWLSNGTWDFALDTSKDGWYEVMIRESW